MPYHTEKDVKNSKPKSTNKKPPAGRGGVVGKRTDKKDDLALNPGFGMKEGTGRLSKFQKDFMDVHSKSHSKAHNDMMVKLMKEGMCPERAHQETMKKVGK